MLSLRSTRALLALSALLAAPARASQAPTAASNAGDVAVREQHDPRLRSVLGSALSLHGYAEINAAWRDHGANRNRPDGAQPDSRLLLDTARLVLGLDVELPVGFALEAELELEHGGVGAAMELEYEEFGEFELELERGGAVVLEELALAWEGGPIELAAGRIPLAIGMLARRHRPTQRLRPLRAEGEQTVLPAVWTEIGANARLQLAGLGVTAQLINGLDSTGFSSQGWVSTGHQRRFELTSATAPAGVLRLDWTGHGVSIGASGYYGGSSRNRPKPDLVVTCDTDSERVGACGWIPGDVAIVAADLELDRDGVVVRISGAWGHLRNAERISERNARLSNHLDVLRSAVADEAYFVWVEVGYDVARHFAFGRLLRITPYVALERYDTMSALDGGRFDNPRFERTLAAAGAQLVLAEQIVASLGWSLRTFGNPDIRREQGVDLLVGARF